MLGLSRNTGNNNEPNSTTAPVNAATTNNTTMAIPKVKRISVFVSGSSDLPLTLVTTFDPQTIPYLKGTKKKKDSFPKYYRYLLLTNIGKLVYGVVQHWVEQMKDDHLQQTPLR